MNISLTKKELDKILFCLVARELRICEDTDTLKDPLVPKDGYEEEFKEIEQLLKKLYRYDSKIR